MIAISQQAAASIDPLWVIWWATMIVAATAAWIGYHDL